MNKIIMYIPILIISILFSACATKESLIVNVDKVKSNTSISFNRVDNAYVIVAPASKEAIEYLDKNGPLNIKNGIRGELESLGIIIGKDLTIKVSLETQREGMSGTAYYYDKDMKLLATINIFVDPRIELLYIFAPVEHGFVNEVVAYAKRHFLIVLKSRQK